MSSIKLHHTKPLVSVVIPSYNHAQFIQQTIKSIIDQDYKNIELIIIDDGSLDDSETKIKEMLHSCEERFIRFEYRRRHNKGLSATLNEALSWSKGEYFSAVGSDDFLKNNRFSTQIDNLSPHKDVVAYFSGVEVVNSQGKVLFKRPNKRRVYSFKDIILAKANLPAPTSLIKRAALLDIGGFNEELKIEDFDAFLRLTENGEKICTIPDCLVFYRRHDANFSSNRDDMWKNVLLILERYKESSLYKRALAKQMLIQAHSLQATERSSSFCYALKALKNDFRLIFKPGLYWYLIKFLRA